MDLLEATRVVLSRIEKLEPENARKIIGQFLVQGHGYRDMIRLAFGPDRLIQNLIYKTKIELGLGTKPAVLGPISPSMNLAPVSDTPRQFTPFPPASPRPFETPAALQIPVTTYWEHQPPTEQQLIHNSDFGPLEYSDSFSELQNQTQFSRLDNQLDPVSPVLSGFLSDYYYPEAALSARSSPRSPSLPEFPVKVCHYFNKGFCKHGSNCRYYHGQAHPESFTHMFGLNTNEFLNDDHMFLPGSLEKLELEITELLKSRRGHPVSIASLPMIYYEKYGKVLQAEGYLTESQRHGKAGYSLTKLLARLKNSIRLIDSTFGPVEDVRIPCQQKRMFGFVTFESADTVKVILAKGNPHFVCGARVLVKPYREKSKLADRKYAEKFEPQFYFPSHYIDMDSELNLMSRGSETSRLLRQQLMEEHEQALELETRRLAELQLAQQFPGNQPYFGYCMDELKVSEEMCAEHSMFPSAERFNHLLDVLNNGSASDDKPIPTGFIHTDQES
ncbi:hypothetical protein L1049_001018 [Liquidambar formosana]|uniref:C3H1-type domain-containing protein n=1 Tax=Liquidambar formosana TaxID=63359 RepID=A0AAP0R5T0_LIQFO